MIRDVFLKCYLKLNFYIRYVWLKCFFVMGYK